MVHQLRPRQGRRHPLCTGPDPAHLRRSEHPCHVCSAAAERQRGRSRRRRVRAARRAQRPGRNRHGHAGQRAARLPQVGQHHRPRHPRSLAREPDLLRRLLHQQAQVHGVCPQGVVRRQRHGQERLRLRLVAQGPQPRRQRLDRDVFLREDEGRHHPGLLRMGHEPLLQMLSA